MSVISDEVLSDLVSLPEAASYLELHRATVNNMVINGRLRGYRLGAHWYIRKGDLEVFKRSYHRPKGSTSRGAGETKIYWTAELLRWLLHWETATTVELDRVLDLHVGNIRKYLAFAEHDGLVNRDRLGFWSLTDIGRKHAEALPCIEERKVS